jgi:hypothetical protein
MNQDEVYTLKKVNFLQYCNANFNLWSLNQSILQKN